MCADVLLSGWYRFGGEAGSQMANKCVQENHCGIRHPGWLSGGHPTMADGTVVRKVCFNYFRGCCQGSIYISVRNCGGFYVYNLKSLSCYFRYCASNGSEPTTAFTTGKNNNELTSLHVRISQVSVADCVTVSAGQRRNINNNILLKTTRRYSHIYNVLTTVILLHHNCVNWFEVFHYNFIFNDITYSIPAYLKTFFKEDFSFLQKSHQHQPPQQQ